MVYRTFPVFDKMALQFVLRELTVACVFPTIYDEVPVGKFAATLDGKEGDTCKQ